MKHLPILLLSLFFLTFTACKSPRLFGKDVKEEFYKGGKIRSKFIMDDETEQNGFLKLYGYDGHLTSTVPIHNGVKDGMETGYDKRKRVLWHYRYVNGKQHGLQKAYYPNGDTMIMYKYRNGMKHGSAYAYNKDGSIHQKVIYSRGKIVN